MTRLVLVLCLFTAGLLAQKSDRSDADIEAQIHAKLAKSKIAADHFTVRVKGGVVYWEGTTSVGQHKGAATRLANTSGARRVVNNIQVNAGRSETRSIAKSAIPASAAKPAQPVAQTSSDAASSAAPAASSDTKRVTVHWQTAHQ